MVLTMTLDHYLRSEQETSRSFASRIGLSLGAVNKLRQGETCPAAATMRRVLIATKGAVTYEDFLKARKGTEK